jgi:hypothetical protein
MTDHSLRLDSSGYPHLAYGGIRLYYARKVGTNWIVQEIDNRRASEASLALDRNDYPHISYVSDSKLQYIHWNGAQWIKETVDDRYSRYTSIALDSSDHPQISYCGVEGLMLARRNNSGWIITSVGLSCGQSNSLALDSNSYAHISCDCAGQPMYVHWTGTGWSSETLPHTLLAGSFTSIALDDDDHPHITYYDQRFDIFDLGGLVYNYWDGSKWVRVFIESETSDKIVGQFSSIAVDKNGHPHISYVAQGQLKYAFYNDMGLRVQTVESGNAWVSNTSITVDSNGQPHIAYQLGYDMKYAHWDGSSWVIEVIDDGGVVGRYSSVALDMDNRAHIGYVGDGRIKYSKWDGADWVIQNIDVGYGYISLALNSNGYPHISYAKNDMVMHAFWQGTSWVTSTIDGGSNGFTSLALDSNDRVHVAYGSYDYLKYAYTSESSTAWISQTVDVGVNGITRIYMRLDAENHPHIVYTRQTSCLDPYGYSTNCLAYAYWDGMKWITQTLYSGDFFGTTLAIDSNNKPHVGYLIPGSPCERAVYAYMDHQNWITETLPIGCPPTWSDPALGDEIILQMDSRSYPHFVIRSAAGYYLEYVYWNGSSWVQELIDIQNQDLRSERYKEVSFSLDNHDQPHITYYDNNENALIYLVGTSVPIYKIYLPLTLRNYSP